ncbi:MAG TPA: FAD:protein FMN transferase, partial [Gaiellales bacterium]|nr:FAD:protein FMN transferase [Gaiellales bacterium]
MPAELDYSFSAMGSDIRLLIGPPLMPSAPAPLVAADREKAFVLDFGARLSRFRPDSELTALNESPAHRVPAGELLRLAVRAGLWAARRSEGLVDPTLVRALERVGYDHSLQGALPASLSDAVASAPARWPARPDPAAAWREVMIDDDVGYVERPPGLAIDTGGTGKGLCADMVARHL